MPHWLQQLFAPPIFDDQEKTRTARILSSFAWIAIGILVGLILLRILVWKTSSTATPIRILFFIILLLMAGQFLIRRGYVREASMFLVSAIWAALTYQSWIADGLRDIATIGYLIIV